MKDTGRRLPLQLQCGYQGQQGDVSQSVRGNYDVVESVLRHRLFFWPPRDDHQNVRTWQEVEKLRLEV